MSAKSTEGPVTGEYGREVRDTIVKSGLTGVAATMLAVTIFSPAGFGGMIGTSLASGLGIDPNVAPADDVYANLPAYPSPLSLDEVAEIQGQLSRTTASLALTRAATEARIDHIRSIALSEGVVTFTPMPQAAPVQTARVEEALRLSLSEPSDAAPLEPIKVNFVPVGGSGADFAPSSHMELAELMFAHENF
jgi:hypothetical protein